jgi:hypothetical protein
MSQNDLRMKWCKREIIKTILMDGPQSEEELFSVANMQNVYYEENGIKRKRTAPSSYSNASGFGQPSPRFKKNIKYKRPPAVTRAIDELLDENIIEPVEIRDEQYYAIVKGYKPDFPIFEKPFDFGTSTKPVKAQKIKDASNKIAQNNQDDSALYKRVKEYIMGSWIRKDTEDAINNGARGGKRTKTKKSKSNKSNTKKLKIH